MRVLILGAGGIGGAFGVLLHEAGGDVTFKVRPERARRLRDGGLQLRSPRGDARIEPRLAAGDASDGRFDLAILSCKAYDLPDAIDAIAPAVDDDTCVLPLLNGLAHLDALDARFGAARVLGGVAQISVALDADGAIRQFHPFQRVIAGARGGRADPPALRELGALFASANVDFVASRRIEQDMWEKFVFISTLAGACCTMRAPVGTILQADGGEHFILGLLRECEEIAAAHGHAPDADRLDAYRRQLAQHGSPLEASMLRDIERGNRTEGAHVLGDLLARARSAQLKTPLLEIANAHVQAYELRRAHVS
ncbi:MAG TPA: 2-dehydropantoate 2-reductase [Burkholderiaceae bacterium]|nr:2-dehydropantoate 2-reductase [Burkholderiaceae bacterium]